MTFSRLLSAYTSEACLAVQKLSKCESLRKGHSPLPYPGGVNRGCAWSAWCPGRSVSRPQTIHCLTSSFKLRFCKTWTGAAIVLLCKKLRGVEGDLFVRLVTSGQSSMARLHRQQLQLMFSLWMGIWNHHTGNWTWLMPPKLPWLCPHSVAARWQQQFPAALRCHCCTAFAQHQLPQSVMEM